MGIVYNGSSKLLRGCCDISENITKLEARTERKAVGTALKAYRAQRPSEESGQA